MDVNKEISEAVKKIQLALEYNNNKLLGLLDEMEDGPLKEKFIDLHQKSKNGGLSQGEIDELIAMTKDYKAN